MIVDSNVYWFDEEIFNSDIYLEEFLGSVPRHYGTNAYIKMVEDGKKQIVVERPRGFENLNYVEGDYQLEKILADMDTAGIDQAVLKIPGCHEWLTLEQCITFNNGMYDYMKRSNGRLVPLAVVPPVGSPLVFKELDRCFNELGFRGVQLVTHYGDYYLDDAQFSTFFEELNQYKVSVYIHHTPVPTQYDALYEFTNVRRSYGRCVDQTTAICRELYSGFFEKYPDLKFVHSMLGGGFFGIKNLIVPNSPRKPDKANRFSTDNTLIKQHLESNVYFEMSHAQPWGKEALESAIQILGADHIIFGSSYPVRQEWLTEGPAFIADLEISEEEKNLILYENACRLYQIS